jgi:hypothetical protein
MSDALERVTLITPDEVAPVGHDEKMIALVDAKAAENSGRPSWLPEKFATAEDMAASYKALEAKQGGATPPVVPAAPVVAPVATAPADPLAITTAPADATAVVQQAGLNMADLNTEFATAGTLSEASYTKLAAVGFDKAAVDNYVAGQQALVAQFQNEVMSATPGGSEKYGEMVAWAKVNMTEAQVSAYNTAVSSGNKDQAKLAVAGLGASFTAAVGREPVLQGGRVSGGVTDVFESLAQMKVAMSDSRYKADPAFRNAVQQKLGRSNIM